MFSLEWEIYMKIRSHFTRLGHLENAFMKVYNKNMNSKWLTWLFLLLAFLSLSCQPKAVPEDKVPEVRNVILVAIDTLRAEHIGFMGYDRPTTPFLDEFAKRCIVFNRAYTPRALTLPAFASLLSGNHVVNHRINENGLKLPDELHLLAEDFKNAGFVTVGYPAAEVISSKYGLHRGFDFYMNVSHTPGAQVPGSVINDAVGRFLKGTPEQGELSFAGLTEPVFLFIHYFDTHTPYTPSPSMLRLFGDPEYNGPFTGGHGPVQAYNRGELELNDTDLQHARDMYDAEIRILDGYMQQLFALFDEAGLMDNSIIAFTADHGENFGEHHALTHGHPYEDGLRIPLMFHLPGDYKAGKRINALVELTDVLPTVMDITKVGVNGEIDGKSLLPLLADDPGYPERKYLLARGGHNNEDKPTFGLFDGKFRLMRDIRWSETTLLYDISKDPHEATDIASDNKEVVKLMSSIIDVMAVGLAPPEIGEAILAGRDIEQELDPETEEMLRSLGYLN